MRVGPAGRRGDRRSAAVVVAGAAVLSAEDVPTRESTSRVSGKPRRRAEARARPRRARRRRGAAICGGRPGSTTPVGSRRPDGCSRGTTRSRPRSVRRSPAGPVRTALPRSTGSSSSAPCIRAARSPSSTSASRASGPARRARSRRGGRRGRWSRTRSTPCAPTTSCIRSSRRGSRSSSRPQSRPQSSRASRPRQQLEALRAAADSREARRDAALRDRAAAARPAGLRAAGLRRGRPRAPGRGGGARRLGRRPLHEGAARRRLLAARPADAALSRGRDRALPPRRAAPVAAATSPRRSGSCGSPPRPSRARGSRARRSSTSRRLRSTPNAGRDLR